MRLKIRLIVLFSFFVMYSNLAIYGQSKVNVVLPRYYQEVYNDAIELHQHELTIKKVNKEDHKPNEKYLSYSEYIEIDKGIWNDKSQGVPNSLSLMIEFEGKKMSLLLNRRYLKVANYHLSTSSSKTGEDKIDGYYYNGIVEGEPGSWATLAVVNNEYRVLIASELGNIEIDHLHDDLYVIYRSEDLIEVPEYKCHTKDESSYKSNDLEDNRSVGSDCVELYIECDNQSYIDNGNSVANTEAWALALMNDVATIYNTIDIPLVINGIFVWDTVDPYSNATSIHAMRDSFIDQIGDGYDGRVAQLFSTRPMGGGLAYGVGGLCGDSESFPGPYSVVTSLDTNYDPYPNFSFTVNVVAHELGHIFGARHTHACVWGSGLDTQIDDCGNIYASNNGDQPEGDQCFDINNPILPVNGGTIMSFCNLEGGGIDLANGFGTEVGDLIYNNYINATCATGDICASIPPSNNDCINATVLPANGICNLMKYDNVLASASGITDPSCGDAGIGVDIWFQFVPTFTDYTLDFSPMVNGVEDVIISLYSGSCGALVEEQCDEGTNDVLSLKYSGLIIGNTYYIRIIEFESDEFGDFELCLVNEFLPCHPAFNPLVDLYNSTNGSLWDVRYGWGAGVANNNCSPCSWYGITCDNQENVIGIDLFNNNLVGTVPSSLGELTALRTLKLMNNDLSGSFPDIWTDLQVMEIVDLSNNAFTGNMPSSIGNMTKLNTLYIENNNLDGSLLSEIGNLPLINVYWANNNNFSGCYPDSYSNLCDVASVKFTNNPLLPSGGNDFEGYCSFGFGSDIDNDGFCFGTNVGEDCVDDDATIFPNAPELCDGKDNDCDLEFDEGLVDVNTWILSTGGDWSNASNWSQGITPEPCHDVVFPMSGSSKTILVNGGEEAFARSVTIYGNNNLINNGQMTISGSDEQGLLLGENASFINNNATDIKNINLEGIRTNGAVENSGTIVVDNLGTDFEVYILSNGTIINNGILNLK